ncbi:MAG TPA: hypothetical protein PKU88_10445 [Bacillota bacterium]|nr:hypothetical protein [Clostridiaceae bacterium]HNR05236.1 hypothetical protein [Bacillota bacterium]HNT03940.1 hypothetical protein [Bacillota bacterium]HPL99522.1 hypothetical protein [Bacillota bacterium]HPX69733.1 hypothetical protein [Bacillota bacterium]
MDTEIVLPQEGRERAGTAEAKLAGRMLLTSSIIVNVIEEDTFLVLASVLSVIASLLTIKAARLEAEEQQIAPGVTTFANSLKLIGSHTGLFVSIILLWALLIEISIKQTTELSAQPEMAGTLGAFMV